MREEVKFNHHRLTRCVCELTRDKKIVGENDNDNENRGEMGRQKIVISGRTEINNAAIIVVVGGRLSGNLAR